MNSRLSDVAPDTHSARPPVVPGDPVVAVRGNHGSMNVYPLHGRSLCGHDRLIVVSENRLKLVIVSKDHLALNEVSHHHLLRLAFVPSAQPRL